MFQYPIGLRGISLAGSRSWHLFVRCSSLASSRMMNLCIQSTTNCAIALMMGVKYATNAPNAIYGNVKRLFMISHASESHHVIQSAQVNGLRFRYVRHHHPRCDFTQSSKSGKIVVQSITKTHNHAIISMSINMPISFFINFYHFRNCRLNRCRKRRRSYSDLPRRFRVVRAALGV